MNENLMSDSCQFKSNPPLKKIDQQAVPNFVPWLVCLVGALFFFYEFIQMNVLNALSNHLMLRFHINAEGLSLLSSAFFYADAGLLIIAGIILDRVSTRRVILWTLALCTAGVFLFAFAHHYPTLVLGRVLAGIGNSFCFLACMRLAARWFPAKKMALVMGVVVTIGMLGGAVVQTPFVWLIKTLGASQAMLINGVLGVLILIAIFCFVKDAPNNSSTQAASSGQSSASPSFGFWTGLGAAANNRQVWFGGLYTCFLNLPVILLGALWGSLFLQRVFALSVSQAATVCSMIFIGMIVGCPLVGYLSDKMLRRRLPMILGAIISLGIVMLILMLRHLSYPVLLALFFLLGLITSSQVITYPLVSETSQVEFSSTAMGITAMLIMGGGAVVQDISGWLLNLHWNHAMHNGVPYYTLQDYRFALMILPVAFVVALLCAFGVRETYCRELK